uniref:Uncharacterized protein n=1 Tax=Daphnia magna TaxID=35525 RepID=A0A0P6AXV5_9CRUS
MLKQQRNLFQKLGVFSLQRIYYSPFLLTHPVGPETVFNNTDLEGRLCLVAQHSNGQEETSFTSVTITMMFNLHQDLCWLVKVLKC